MGSLSADVTSFATYINVVNFKKWFNRRANSVGLFLITFFFFGSGCLHAEDPAKKSALPEYASVKKSKVVSISKSKASELSVELKIQEGFHIQANPASLPNLIPTTLVFDKVETLEVGDVIYPEGEPHSLQGSSGNIMAYSKELALKAPVKAKAEAPAGKITLTGRLRYQACNEKTCFFPVTVPVSIPVKIN